MKIGEFKMDAENHSQLSIPAVLVCGFLVLSPTAELFCIKTDFYHPQSEFCLAFGSTTRAIKGSKLLGVSPNPSTKDLTGLSWEKIQSFNG
jgi:dTDP-4-dehydrorhamnose 3,5-epimerase